MRRTLVIAITVAITCLLLMLAYLLSVRRQLTPRDGPRYLPFRVARALPAAP